MSRKCPSKFELLRLALGELKPAQADAILVHLDVCTICDHELEKLEDDGDEFILHLRTKAADETVEDTVLDEAGCQRALMELLNLERRLLFDPAESLAAAQLLPEIRDYQLREQIGEGGIGRVYRAEHTRLKRSVAIKVLRHRPGAHCPSRERFLQEMAVVGRLNHPNVVRATDAGEVGDTPFLVMEFLEGVDLAELIKECGPLHLGDACELIRQAAAGLEYAHSLGLVHRDVKPSNLMLESAGLVKVLDLGLASSGLPALGASLSEDDETKGNTRAGELLGTTNYMAPEQATDPVNADQRADVYSLGCTFFYLLTGRSPFDRESDEATLKAHCDEQPPNIHDYRPDLPPELTALLQMMLAKDPQDRVGSMREVIQGIDRCTPKLRIASQTFEEESLIGICLAALRSHARESRNRILRTRRKKIAVGLSVCLVGLVLALGTAQYFRTPGKGAFGVQETELSSRLTLTTADNRQLDLVQGMSHEIPVGSYSLRVDDPNNIFASTSEEIHIRESTQRMWRTVIEFVPKKTLPLKSVMGLSSMAPLQLACSADASHIVACIENRDLRTWNTDDGGLTTHIPSEFAIGLMEISPGGEFLMYQHAASSIEIVNPFDVEESKLVYHMPFACHLSAAAMSIDLNWLACGDRAGRICCWHLPSGRRFHTDAGEIGQINSLLWSPDATRLFAASTSGQLLVLDTKSNSVVRQWNGHDSAVNSLAYIAKDDALVSASNDKTLKAWDLQSDELMTEVNHPAPVQDCFAIPNSAYVLTACRDGLIRLVELASGQVVSAAETRNSFADHIRFLPEKREVWAITRDRMLRTWDARINVALPETPVIVEPKMSVPRLLEVQTLAGHEHRATSVLLDGDRLYSGSDDGSVIGWDWQKGTRTGRFDVHNDAFVLDMAHIPTTGQIASSDVDGGVYLWEADNPNAYSLLTRQPSAAQAVVSIPGTDELVVGFRDGTVHQFNHQTGAHEGILTQHGIEVTSLAKSPDGRYVASGDWDGNLHLYDRETEAVMKLSSKHSGLFQMSFSPDSKQLATAGWDMIIRVWDLPKMSVNVSFPSHHDGPISAFAYSSDGSMLATACRFGELKIWDAKTQKVIASASAHNDTIRDVVFSQDDRQLATASHDTLVKIWELPPSEPPEE